MPRPLRIPDTLLEIIVCICLVFQGSGGQTWELTVVAVVEDCLQMTWGQPEKGGGEGGKEPRKGDGERTKYCPSAAKLLASPAPPNVSIMG